MDFLKRTWAEICTSALKENYQAVRGHLQKGCKMMAIVKADGYGHGAAEVAGVLQALGADWFGVSNLDEAIILRNGGITAPILVLGYTPVEQIALLKEQEITQTIFSAEYADNLQKACEKEGIQLSCQIKLDTGMNRLGFLCDEKNREQSLRQIEKIKQAPCFQIDGIFTHFASADEAEEDADRFTQKQFAVFVDVLEKLAQRGVTFSLRHCANSAATLRFPAMHLDMVRPGIVLYGVAPTPACQGILPLRPAMTLKSTVAMVKEVQAGACISYGRTFHTKKAARLATVPVGYADGYRRNHSNDAFMVVRGKKVPVVGTICMDQLVLDVSDVPDLAMGEEVIVFGPNSAVNIEDLAKKEHSIPYEVMCLVGKRVPRVYKA